MMTKIKQFLVRLLDAEHPAVADYQDRLKQCRAQEANLVQLLHRESMRIAAAAELCRDFQATDELGNPIRTEADFIGFADRRARTLTGKD